MSEPTVILPKATIQALFDVYDTWWNKIATLDPGEDSLRGYSLITNDDCTRLEEACVAVEEYESAIKAVLA